MSGWNYLSVALGTANAMSSLRKKKEGRSGKKIISLFLLLISGPSKNELG